MEMRKFNVILALLIIFSPVVVYASAPTRAYNYSAHTTIDPSQNNANENALYSYLQAGVDTYASGSLTNDAVSSIAAISYSKLNLVGSVKNADISTSAAIAYSKLSLSNSIVDADISSSAAITDSKLAAISTAGKVSGAAFTSLGSVPSGAGIIPAVNLASKNQFFASSGTFTAPTGVTKVYLTMVGGGAGGGSGNASDDGGGGGAGASVVNYPYTVVAGNSYTVTIAATGTANTDGGASVFDALSIPGGSKGANASAASNGGAGGQGIATNTTSTSGSTATVPGVSGGNGYKAPGGGVPGAGGSSMFGSGGAGSNGNPGGAGTGFGAGGGGGSQNGVTAAGSGSPGFVLVEW